MLRRSACLAVAGLALLAAPASGAELLSTSLSTPAAVKRTCHAKLLTGGAGYVQRQVTAPATGVISARLNGQPRGRLGSRRLRRQGAHRRRLGPLRQRRARRGDRGQGPAPDRPGVSSLGARPDRPAPRRRLGVAVATGDNRVQLVRVSTPTRAAKDRLLATGLDLTEHGSATYLDVVLHGADDVQTLTTQRLHLPGRDPGPRQARPGGAPAEPLERRPEPGDAQRAHELPPPAGLLSRHEAARRGPPRAGAPDHAALPHPRGTPRRGNRDHQQPARARRQAGVPADGRSTTPASGPRASTPSSGPTSSSTTTARTSGPPISSTGRGRSSSRSSTRTASTSRARSRSRTRPSTRSRARCRSTPGSRWSTPASPTSGATAAWSSSTRAKAATRRARAPARRRRTAPTASTRTETTAASGAGPAPAPTRPATPSGATGRSRSPRPGTCSGWSPTAR